MIMRELLFLFNMKGCVYLSVMCHPIEHPAHIQSPMTLPTRPHAIFSTWQGTQKPTL
jgi:hypothetical protein